MKGLFILFLISCFTPVLNAEDVNYQFEHFTTAKGLSHNYVTCILKDNKGYMWIGTQDGLNRFDGVRFEVFKSRLNDPNSLAGNYIVGMVQDRKGCLWVATNAGLCKYDPLRKIFLNLVIPVHGFTFQHRNMSNPILKTIDEIWIIADRQIYNINIQTMAIQKNELPAYFDDISSLSMDEDGLVWIKNDGAIYLWDVQKHVVVYCIGKDRLHTSAGIFCSGLFNDKKGQLFLTTAGNGLFYFEKNSQRFTQFGNGTLNTILSCAQEDVDDQGKSFFWVGGGKNGLAIYNPTVDQIIEINRDARDAYSHNGSFAVSIFKDRESGIVWVGTMHGLEMINPKAFHFIKTFLPDSDSSVPFDQITSFAESGEKLWIAKRGGVIYEQTKNLNAYHKDGFVALPGKHKMIQYLLFSKRKFLWIAEAGRVAIYDPTHLLVHSIPLPNAVTTQHAVTLFEDSKENMWIGTQEGYVFEYNFSSAALAMRIEPDTGASPITALAEDQQKIWVCTLNRGIYAINKKDGVKEKFIYRNIHLDCTINSCTLLVDSKNQLWLGGNGYLLMFDATRKLKKQYSVTNGFDLGSVYHILQDRLGFIWIATTNKLYRLDEITNRLIAFDETYGLFDNDVSGGFFYGISGVMYAGFQNGFNRVRPISLALNNLKAPLVINSIKIDQTEVDYRDSDWVIIKPGQRTLRIEFAALNFIHPDRNRYAFELTGPEDHYDTISGNDITFSNLKSGQYTLVIKGANNDGIWSNKTIKLRIRVEIPYIETIWFKIQLLMILVIITLFFYFNRIRNYQNLLHIREEIAKDLHDDIGSTLSSIRIYSDVLLHELKEHNYGFIPILEKIRDNAKELTASLEEIVWSIQIKHDRIEDLSYKMREFAVKILEAKNIGFQLEVSDEVKRMKIGILEQRNLYLIYKEAINNALKYANCTIICVSLKEQQGKIQMVIMDNGIGFVTKNESMGNGLKNLKARAKKIRGQADIKSGLGMGTSIEIRIKIR